MPEPKKFELSSPAAIIIAGAVIAGAILFVNKTPDATGVAAVAAAQPTELAITPPSANEHLLGSPDAPIVLVEYSDFQCPYCAVIYPSLKNIVANSGGQIALIQRAFPLTSIHPNALPAANAAECITEQLGNAGYWKFADAAFANQSKLSSGYYEELASQFGADLSKYKNCVANATYQGRIDQQSTEAQTAGGNGTPFTIVVDTKTSKMVPFSGALPQSQIQAIINSFK